MPKMWPCHGTGGNQVNRFTSGQIILVLLMGVFLINSQTAKRQLLNVLEI